MISNTAMRLTSGDWQSMEFSLRGLFAPGLNAANYVARCFEAIGRLVPGEFTTYSRSRPGALGVFEIVFSLAHELPAAPLEAFARLKVGCPLWDYRLHEQGGRPIFRRDYLSVREFRRTAMFAEAYQPMELDNHCAVPVCGCGECGAAMFFSIERKGAPDFTERDRAVLSILQPHLVAALTLARERPACRRVSPGFFSRLALTAREAEIFHWLVEGKRNSEIAIIIGTTLQTVKSHVSSIFQKLGVENRLSATLLGLETIRRAQADEMANARFMAHFQTK